MTKQIVQIQIDKKSGCDITQAEYSITFTGLIGFLDFTERGGESDYHRVIQGVEEWVSSEHKNFDHGIDSEYAINLMLSERTEQQDVFTEKWFEVDSYEFVEGL